MSEQAVVDESNASDAKSAGQDAQDELDQLLNEFDQQSEPQKTTQKPDSSDDDVVRQWAREEMQRSMQERANTAVNDATKVVMEGLNVSERMAKNFLLGEAENDPRVLNAWKQREQSPEKWNQILKGLNKALKGELDSRPDTKTTQDREVVESAVRGAQSPSADEAFDENKVRGMDLDSLYKEFPDLAR